MSNVVDVWCGIEMCVIVKGYCVTIN